MGLWDVLRFLFDIPDRRFREAYFVRISALMIKVQLWILRKGLSYLIALSMAA
jgi:hypothetical protein